MIQLSCPGKTFLCGEYGVLSGGQALVLNTQPRFKLLERSHPEHAALISSQKYKVTNLSDIHPNSQAGEWMKTVDFPWDRFDFLDPYMGQGGFGASTAQFLFTYTLKKRVPPDFLKPGASIRAGDRGEISFTASELHTAFLQVSNRETPPSGVDLIAQYFGQITWVDRQTLESKVYQWPFKDLEFFIVPTGFKVASHEHLQNVVFENLSNLSEKSKEAVQAFKDSDQAAFVTAINDWGHSLRTQGFLASTSAELVEHFTKLSGVLAAKGCGALGADTILLLVEKSKVEQFTSELTAQAEGMGISGAYRTREDLSSGLEVHIGN